MKKYLKITIVLFSICLVCALAVAGVNTFTAPKIEEYQNQLKMEAYQGLFPNMDAATTTFTNEGFKSSYVKEKAVVKDASGQDLGLGFQVSGSNSYGSITLVVALDTEGNLLGLSCTENTQTGGRNTMINEYLTQFTSGMTAEEVADHPVYTGATFGSNLVKNLLAAAFSEAGIMSEIQETLVGIFGDNVDMAQTVEKTSLIYAQQVETGYTVKDSAGTVLGYYYVVNMSNRFGNINVAVSLNPDFTVKQIDQIDVTQRPYGSNDTTQIAKDFISGIQAGSSYDDVNGLATVSKATISTTSAKAAILVAIKEAQNTFDENLALRIMFYNYANVTEVTEGKLDTVDKYQSVVDSENKEIGQVVSVVSDSINLYVGIDSNDKLAGIFVVAGNSDSITSAVKAIEIGSDGTTAVTAAGTNIRELVATAFEQVTGVRPQPGYDVQYATLFEGVDTSKSQDYDISSLDAQFDEGKSLYDANGTLLGYGFVLTSTANEFDGTLTIMVGVQVSGKLQKVIMLSNDQTGGYGSLIEGYEDKFTEGMSASDVNAVANATPNNLGSGQMKSLIVLALKAIAAYDDYYIEVFGEGISTTDIEVNRDEIIQGVKVTKDGIDLGYAYIVRLENSYGYNVMCVALNANGTFKKLVDVENNHANLTEIATVFEDGSNMEQIIAQGNSDKAIEIGASYTSEIATLGIKIAMDACSGNLTESVSDEIYIKTLFSYAVMRRCEELETITNSPITKAYKVVGVSNKIPGQDLGYVYFLTVENEDILMSLVVGVDINHNYVGAVMTDYVTKVSLNVNGSFSDTLQGKVTSYLAELVGMSDAEIKNAPYYETASYASQLVKYALRLCIAESNSVAMARPNLYSDNQIYLNAIDGLDLLSTTRIDSNTFLYPNIISGIRLADGSQAYIVDVINGYSHNYILVYVDSSNKLISLYDVENNHGAISSVSSLFTSGMTLEQVEEIKYNTQADASFTIEMTKLAIRMVMTQAASTKDNTLVYENAAKVLFPLMVTGRSEILEPVNSNVKYAVKAVGVIGYTNGQTLGYVYALADLAISVDTAGNYLNYYAISTLSAEQETFLKSLQSGSNRATIEALTDESGAKDKVVELLVEADLHLGLTIYDDYITKAFSDYDIKSSELIESQKDYVLAAVNVSNSEGNTLGYAYVIKLENVYGYNEMLVALDANGNLLKALDISNSHSNIDNWQNTNPNVFVSGMTPEQINTIKYDTISGSSYTIETIRLGILLAMNEVRTDLNNSALDEYLIKKLFNNAVFGRCIAISEFSDSHIIRGYEVYGIKSGEYSSSLIGYAYVVHGTLADVDGKPTTPNLTLLVGVNLDSTLCGALIADNGQTAGRAPSLETFINSNFGTSGSMTEGDIDQAETISKATYGCNLAKMLIKLALKEGQTSTYNALIAAEYAAEGYSSATSQIIESTNSKVMYAVDVKNEDGNSLGKAFVMYGTLADVFGKPASANITLMVYVNTDGTLKTVSIVHNGQTAGRNSLIEEFVQANYTSSNGMTATEVDEVTNVSKATYGSNLVKDLIKTALAEGGSN